MVTVAKSGIFRPFQQLACALCLVKHFWPLVVVMIKEIYMAKIWSPSNMLSQQLNDSR